MFKSILVCARIDFIFYLYLIYSKFNQYIAVLHLYKTIMKSLCIFLSLILLGCNSSNREEKSANCVKLVFEKDSVFGNIRNYDSEKVPLSEAITNYSNNSKSLDFSNCPKEFELAFRKHIDAWLDFTKVSDKHPTLRGELHDIFAEIEKSKDSTEFKSRLAQILETWKFVKEVSK